MPPPDPRAVLQNDGILPTRFAYPNTEYSLNEENVRNGVSLNGGSENDMKTRLWWSER